MISSKDNRRIKVKKEKVSRFQVLQLLNKIKLLISQQSIRSGKSNLI
jgi:hypothetical protein